MDPDTVFDLDEARETVAMKAQLEDIVGEADSVRELGIQAERYTERMKVIEYIEELLEGETELDTSMLISDIANGLHRYDLDD